ncbi:MAG: signal peptidase I, partial [Lachnospiraceae bacterium]|nr:signal peptidase I [Lachnospiraceae bacterium]
FPYKLDEKTFFIKRVIGLPGETVYIDAKGTIYINGEKLEESYGREVIANPGLASSEITLAEDEYFVLGDNRNNSEDSRFDDVGNIKRSDLIGRAWVRIYPFSEMGAVNK